MAVLHRSVGGTAWERVLVIVMLRPGSLGGSVVVDPVQLLGTVDDAVFDSRLVLGMDGGWLVGAHGDGSEQVSGRRPWWFRVPWIGRAGVHVQ